MVNDAPYIPDDFDDIVAEYATGEPPASQPETTARPSPPPTSGAGQGSLYVDNGQGAVARPGGGVTHLATDNVAGCLGIVMQNPQTGAVGLVHVHANHYGTDLAMEWDQLVKPILDQVSPNGVPVNFQVFGGVYPPEFQDSGQHFVNTMLNRLENTPNANMVSVQVGDIPHPSGVVVDVNTGDVKPGSPMVSTFDEVVHYTNTHEGQTVDFNAMPRVEAGQPNTWSLNNFSEIPDDFLDDVAPAASHASPSQAASDVVHNAGDFDSDATVIQSRPHTDVPVADTVITQRPQAIPAVLEAPTVITPQSSSVQVPEPEAVTVIQPHAATSPAPHVTDGHATENTTQQLAAQAADHIGHLGKHSGLIGGVALGVVAGAAALVATGSMAEAAQTVYETAVPYGETQLDLAQGDLAAATTSATIETASNLGGMGGAAMGAAAGFVVAGPIGAAAGAVIGGVGGGVAVAMATEAVIENGQAILNAGSEAVAAVGTAVASAAESVSSAASSAAESVSNAASSASTMVADATSQAWSSLTSLFNDKATAYAEVKPDVKAAPVQQAAEPQMAIRSPEVEAVAIRTPMEWRRTETAAAFGGHDSRKGSFGSSVKVDDPTSKGALSASVFQPTLMADRFAVQGAAPEAAPAAEQQQPAVVASTVQRSMAM